MKFFTSAKNPLTAEVRKDGTNLMIEAGSLLLANSGICFVGEMQSFSKEALYLLRRGKTFSN